MFGLRILAAAGVAVAASACVSTPATNTAAATQAQALGIPTGSSLYRDPTVAAAYDQSVARFGGANCASVTAEQTRLQRLYAGNAGNVRAAGLGAMLAGRVVGGQAGSLIGQTGANVANDALDGQAKIDAMSRIARAKGC
ncbi:hypothetical protein JANAI62_11960 [Jannaschia pagri]|uniref:17 kDa surface antigen n=1 Tax=Jannaschia pagri TaxID=2829797 RepID=A0ABQ4NJH6_9RHOB|nr:MULTISPECIES: hypothetical protein [unclassified Jannaschia]GIT90741.1 hypothetical protein JANAI61_11990 [Jannaschia sp. AI_61]GIT94573.1 hypothetical protein JANAI62_11960 [Jannaschia sp. AI_62]